MTPASNPQRLDLAPGQLVRLTRACGTQVACRAGTLWITVDGQLEDVVIGRGQSFTLGSNSSAVVQAIDGNAKAALHRTTGGARCRSLPERLRMAWAALWPARPAGAL